MTAPVGVIGAGAFGAAMAIALAQQGQRVWLWARDPLAVQTMAQTRKVERLALARLPQNVSVTADLQDLAPCQTLLLALPMQALAAFLAQSGPALTARHLVACCKGMDLTTLQGPTALLARACPDAAAMILTGPSFAADIAQGLATALTLAGPSAEACQTVQRQLSGPILRLYRNSDVIGAEMGGAMKNVIAIAAGIVMGAGLGESARAALMTRGFAEMLRFATHLGARRDTLMGLSGFGDLVLTCTSDQSRNFRHGLAIGQGRTPDPAATVEGVATAKALVDLATARNCVADIPVTAMVARITAGDLAVTEAISALMSRPLKEE